jgi:hypothetical protein
MSVEQVDKIDLVGMEKASGDVQLTISDHLPWDEYEGGHLVVLQDKLNAYMRFIESGELLEKFPVARGRNVVITLVGKFPLSPKAELFLGKVRTAIEHAGFRFQFLLMPPS